MRLSSGSLNGSRGSLVRCRGGGPGINRRVHFPDSAAYAAAVIRNIIESTRRLTKFPESGRIVPELNDRGTREVIAHGYRIIYRLQEEHVLVITVLHGRRRLPLLE